MTTNLEITDVEIRPLEKGAICHVTLNGSITLPCRIEAGKENLFVKWESATFATPEIKKVLESHILSTYVINHCIGE
jgi:hypothetical protein